MPYRDPGPDVREWDKEQGAVSLRISAGTAKNPKTGEWVHLDLPFGPKPRLVLAHLNTEALKTRSPEIDVETSLTAFVRRIQKRPPTGPEIRAFKDQLSRLATATIRMAMTTEDRVFQINNQIVSAFDLLISVLRLSQDYFASLQTHAVPLNELALGGQAHSTMAPDLYAWLAQRLHRVPRGKPQFIAWAALLRSSLVVDWVR